MKKRKQEIEMKELNSDMKHYVAVILTKTSSTAPGYRPLYEEDLVLVVAASEDDAKEQAISQAKKKDDRYQNGYGQQLTSSFDSLRDIQQVDLEVGQTIYSRFFHDYAKYRAFEADTKGLEDVDLDETHKAA